MSTIEMDPVFTAALRDALGSTVKDTPRVRRRWRWRVGTGMFLGVTLVAGGVALASGTSLPQREPEPRRLISARRQQGLPIFHSFSRVSPSARSTFPTDPA